MNRSVIRWLLLLALIGGGLAHRLPADEPYGRSQFDESDRNHWAFLPVSRPDVPAIDVPDWSGNPIDAFVWNTLQQNGLSPAPPADGLTLLRRVHLDLIGLPPSSAEQEAFLHDDSPEAYARVVDDLLARPQYGERWARHWLDVVRYAESNGYERDNPKPHAWRYRDYVIDAFNNDKPFDRFLIEQVAGDEIDGSNAETHIATTFLRLGPWDDEPADPLKDRYDQLDDVLGTTASTFLGLTIRCARCHDHKFEPFKQQDYSRLLAIFEPLERPRDDRDDLDRPVGTAEELTAYENAMAAADQQAGELRRQIYQLETALCARLGDALGDVPAEALAAFQVEPEKRNDDQKKLVEQHRDKLRESLRAAAVEEERTRLTDWEERILRIDAARPPSPPRAYVWFEKGPQPTVTRVFRRGDPNSPLEEIGPGLPAVLVDSPPPAPTPTPRSTGRRRQLAEWLASPRHPLTARVIVNRVWQHHFGDGIVGTENDFGLMGDTPSHPQLLDWLAAELVAGGWRMKRLHRLIVLSNAYRMSAAPNEAAEQIDPAGRLLWRFSPRRLEAEAVRDSILSASGQLRLEPGGPSVYPKISAAVMAGQSRPGNGWTASDASQAARRSIYVFVKRTLLVPEMELLDLPSSNETCEQRTVSTVAPQALTFMNGEFMQEQSRHFAARLAAEAGPDVAAQVERAYRLTLCRPPAAAELTAILEFLARQEQQIQADALAASQEAPDAKKRALEAFCTVLLNTNEFVYLQ